jgi:hypothetical protein
MRVDTYHPVRVDEPGYSWLMIAKDQFMMGTLGSPANAAGPTRLPGSELSVVTRN